MGTGAPKIGSRGTHHSWLPFSWFAMRVRLGVGKGIWGEAQTVCRDRVCVRGKWCEFHMLYMCALAWSWIPLLSLGANVKA